MTTYWVYILICSNGRYYTGYTTHLLRRYREHLQGSKKCKYTRSFKPLCLAQCWHIVGEKAEAMRLERIIKKCSKSEKETLIREPNKLYTYVLTVS